MEETLDPRQSPAKSGGGVARKERRTVHRSNFFLAALWAPLPPILLLVASCLWVLFVPGTLGLGETARSVAGAILIGTPVVYTAVLCVSYLTARALNGVNLLSRLSLLVVCAVVSLSTALVIAFTDLGHFLGVPASIGVVILSFLAMASCTLVWWQVAVMAKPAPEPLYEKRPSWRTHRWHWPWERSRRRGRRERRGMKVEAASNELIVRWDPGSRRLIILHPNRGRFPAPLAEIDELDGMSVPEASQHIGESLTRLIPDLQSRLTRRSASEDGRGGA